MRSFREFFVELTSLGGNYGFPNLDDLRDPNTPPVGGYTSFAQRAGDQIEKRRQDGPLKELYAVKAVLEKFAALAEQVASAIQINQTPGRHSSQHDNYQTASYYNGDKRVITLAEKEILGGPYPRIRVDDLKWGVQNRIFQSYQNPSNGQTYYYFYTTTLSQKMQQLKEQLKTHGREDQGIMNRAQRADADWNKSADVLKGIFYAPSQHKVIGS